MKVMFVLHASKLFSDAIIKAERAEIKDLSAESPYSSALQEELKTESKGIK